MLHSWLSAYFLLPTFLLFRFFALWLWGGWGGGVACAGEVPGKVQIRELLLALNCSFEKQNKTKEFSPPTYPLMLHPKVDPKRLAFRSRSVLLTLRPHWDTGCSDQISSSIPQITTYPPATRPRNRLRSEFEHGHINYLKKRRVTKFYIQQ